MSPRLRAVQAGTTPDGLPVWVTTERDLHLASSEYAEAQAARVARLESIAEQHRAERRLCVCVQCEALRRQLRDVGAGR